MEQNSPHLILSFLLTDHPGPRSHRGDFENQAGARQLRGGVGLECGQSEFKAAVLVQAANFAPAPTVVRSYHEAVWHMLHHFSVMEITCAIVFAVSFT